MDKLTLTHRLRADDVIEVTERRDGSFRLVRFVEGVCVKQQIEHHTTIENIVSSLAFSGYRRPHSVA